MHQSHNIPWSTFEKHFTYVVEDKRYTPPFTGFRYKESPAAVKELQHFARKFTATINEFSETERKKYPTKIPAIPRNAKVFSDALRDKYPRYMNEHYQSLSCWIAYPQYPQPPHYHRIDLIFRDIIMILLLENEMETLLMLAQHPQIQMARMLQLRCDHHQSSRGEESLVWAYLFVNTMEALGLSSNGGYARTEEFKQLVTDIETGVHYCGQQVAHEMLLPWTDTLPAHLRAGYLPHAHFEEVQEYLKGLFAVIYRYDVLAREVKVDPGWERMIKDHIIARAGLNI